MSEVDVEGNDNRVAGRDFQETSISHSTVIIGSVPEREGLTEAQRKRLNHLVFTIEKEHKVDGWFIWKKVVHPRIGVQNIDEILRSQFADAERLLLEYAEQLHSQAHAKRLVAELLDVAKQHGVTQQMTRFCSREFGTSTLNKLNPEQLKVVLQFVEARVERPAEQALPAPAELSWWGQMIEVWKQRPSQVIVVALLAAVVGRLLL